MVIRKDHDGYILILWTGQKNILDAHVTEAYTTLCAIIIAKSRLTHKTVLEGDSIDVIHALRGHSLVNKKEE